jgi:hypothetical protein
MDEMTGLKPLVRVSAANPTGYVRKNIFRSCARFDWQKVIRLVGGPGFHFTSPSRDEMNNPPLAFSRRYLRRLIGMVELPLTLHERERWPKNTLVTIF